MSKKIIKDYKAEVKHLKDWIVSYFCRNGNADTMAVIGISGGKDSTVVAYLCAAALGPDRVVGIKMPNGKQHDIDCADAVIKNLGIMDYQINIRSMCDAFYNEIYTALDKDGELSAPQIRTIEYNLPPRMRMSVLYAIAGAIGGFVANTSNLSERYIGWSTKWGDGAGDFAPLADYTVEEVLAIGKELGVPDELLYKTPEDGLTGKSDEEAIGVEYALIDQYIRGEKPDNYKACRIIHERHEANLHKMAAQNIPHPRAKVQYEDIEDDWAF